MRAHRLTLPYKLPKILKIRILAIVVAVLRFLSFRRASGLLRSLRAGSAFGSFELIRRGASGSHQLTAMRATLQASTHEIDPKKGAIKGLPTAGADPAASNAVLYTTIFVVIWVLIRILLHKKRDAHTRHYNPAYQEQDLEHGLVSLAFFNKI